MKPSGALAMSACASFAVPSALCCAAKGADPCGFCASPAALFPSALCTCIVLPIFLPFSSVLPIISISTGLGKERGCHYVDSRNPSPSPALGWLAISHVAIVNRGGTASKVLKGCTFIRCRSGVLVRTRTQLSTAIPKCNWVQEQMTVSRLTILIKLNLIHKHR